ncbi:MAG: response regulator, partial [Bacteroidia bacterium]|nr:response regulator [Bacteroidia bacterium]MDW8158052.1 response regulator [Bacteroidia bacterium]
MFKPVILCVDDEKAILDSMYLQLKSYLSEECIIELAESAEEAIEIIESLKEQNQKLAVIISDQMLPGMPGDELLIQVHQKEPESKKILITGIGGTDVLAKVVNQAQLFRYLTKPWDKVDLQMTVDSALKSYLQNVQIHNYTHTLEALLYASKKIAKQTTLNNVSHTILSVLIQELEVDKVSIVVFEDESILYEQTTTKEQEYFVPSPKPYQIPEKFYFPPNSIPQLQQYNWENPEYMQQIRPKSYYYMPLFEKEKLSCLVYLEATNQKNYFISERLHFLELLANEIILSIEKAKLIYTLEKKVQQRTTELVEKNKEIEAKNQAIMESIQYAQRLQFSFMQPEENFQLYFPNSFILYRP